MDPLDEILQSLAYWFAPSLQKYHPMVQGLIMLLALAILGVVGCALLWLLTLMVGG